MVRRRASQPRTASWSALWTLDTAARPLMVAGEDAVRHGASIAGAARSDAALAAAPARWRNLQLIVKLS
jgi:hypothetical protein